VAAATAGVASFNGRTGAVSLIATDVTAVLPASTTTPVMNGTASPGTQAAWARGDHVHPVDTSRYAATNPSGFQTAAQVTASLANYLPLAGGTLTGALAGTSANFSGIATFGGTPVFNSGFAIIQQVGAQTVGTFQVNNSASTAQMTLSWNYAAATATWTNVPLTTSIVLDGGGNIQVYPGGAGNLVLNANNAFKPGGGAWASTSDARIKSELGEYEQGLEDVIRLRPVVYVYKANATLEQDGRVLNAQEAKTGRKLVGLIAQEVEPIFPDMVSKTAAYIDGKAVADLRQLDVSALTFALVNAIKTLTARLTALEQAA
jgi:hypothetical protein